MKREMTLTAIRPDGTEVSIVRSFDNEQAAGNFSICRIRVNGKRFSHISCSRELLIHSNHPSESYRELYQAVLDAAVIEDTRAYKRYIKACNRENLSYHTFQAWKIHGNPAGPI